MGLTLGITSDDFPPVGKMIGTLHQRLVSTRRGRVLAQHIASLLPHRARVLDVGCGDGRIDGLILQSRPDVALEGIDVLIRQRTHVPVRPFDGTTIPFPSASFDVVMFVDVLHHTLDPYVLLREAVRVAPIVVVKDHFSESWLAASTLRMMDWVGNAHQQGIALPYNYWNRRQWMHAFGELGLLLEREISPALYPVPFSWIFGRHLHFVSRLAVNSDIKSLGIGHEI